MKTPKPGQLCTVGQVVYRAKKRHAGCKGCDLDDLLLCPNIVDRRKETPPLTCEANGIILKRV